MKNKAKFIILFVISLISIPAVAQDTLNHKTVVPSGFFAGYGQGFYAVKDEYISNEKYSGTMPSYNVKWVRFQSRNGYRLDYEYRKQAEISNNTITADAQQLNFNQDFFYPIGNFPLLSGDVYAYLGPSAQLFYYEIYYRFVTPGTFISPATNGLIGSLGINSELIFRINKKLNAGVFLRSNLISLARKRFDPRKYDDGSDISLLSVYKATKLNFDLSLRYYLTKRISISPAYRFDLSRINYRDPYIAVSNNVILSLNIRI